MWQSYENLRIGYKEIKYHVCIRLCACCSALNGVQHAAPLQLQQTLAFCFCDPMAVVISVQCITAEIASQIFSQILP